MIWYVDIEHDKALADPKRAPDFTRVREERAQISGEAAGVPCEPVLYRQVSSALAKEKRVSAIVISGNTTDWIDYDFATFQPLFDLIHSGDVAVIGLCGGHQLLALMDGGTCDAIRPLAPGEADMGNFAPGWFKEVGFLPVQVIQPDPLFDGLGASISLFESHYWEIKQVPQGYDVLASSRDVRVQVIRHRELPVYGTQFHPEVNYGGNTNGFRLLQNFFRFTGVRKD